ncbi:MAG: TetR/AcrR family transcriptional regulator [Acidobacteriaceae bacterium]|jgi:AcrR family transcriptional regulator
MKPKSAAIKSESEETDVRSARIVTAALEVFSEYSFRDATTDEIARRARVSKRDIYAKFPNKHALLAAVVNMALLAGNERLNQVVSLTQEATSLRERLEVIGFAMVNEILSPTAGFLTRLVASESINQPNIGTIYFSTAYAFRTDLISQVLSFHMTEESGRKRHDKASEAGKHFIALVTHLPQMTMSLGMRDTWNSRSVQTHVANAVGIFLDAHPLLAEA